MSYRAGPTWMCEHGYLDGQGCYDCDPPLRGGPAAVALGLLVLVAMVVAYLAGRWVGGAWL